MTQNNDRDQRNDNSTTPHDRMPRRGAQRIASTLCHKKSIYTRYSNDGWIPFDNMMIAYDADAESSSVMVVDCVYVLVATMDCHLLLHISIQTYNHLDHSETTNRTQQE